MAKEMISTGKSITAQEAYRLGSINKVVPKDKLMEEVNSLIGEILKRSPNIGASKNRCKQSNGNNSYLRS
jgi:enoyl-CoA hydratase